MIPRRERLVSVLAASTVIAGGGCGGESGDRALRDGRHFAYVRALDVSGMPATISIDVADFLTGDEANRAAREAGAIEKGETVPNDYYVRNDDQAIVVVPLARDVRVTHVQCLTSCREKVPGDLSSFAASFREGPPPSLTDEYRGPHSQYLITVQDGEVAAIDEMYLP